MSQETTDGLVSLSMIVSGENPIVPVSKKTIYRMMARGEFPPPVAVFKKHMWRRSDIIKWMNDLAAVPNRRSLASLSSDQ